MLTHFGFTSNSLEMANSSLIHLALKEDPEIHIHISSPSPLFLFSILRQGPTELLCCQSRLKFEIVLPQLSRILGLQSEEIACSFPKATNLLTIRGRVEPNGSDPGFHPHSKTGWLRKLGLPTSQQAYSVCSIHLTTCCNITCLFNQQPVSQLESSSLPARRVQYHCS